MCRKGKDNDLAELVACTCFFDIKGSKDILSMGRFKVQVHL